MEEKEVPKWMITGETLLCVKESEKGSLELNFQPIKCSSFLWKLITRILTKELSGSQKRKELLPTELKWCWKNNSGTKHQSPENHDQIWKERHADLSMVRLGCYKLYTLIPLFWIRKTFEIFGLAEDIGNLIGNSMSGWHTELTAVKENQKRNIFGGYLVAFAVYSCNDNLQGNTTQKQRLGINWEKARGSQLEVTCKKGVLRNLYSFVLSSVLNKVAVSLQLYQKRSSGKGVSLWILRNF